MAKNVAVIFNAELLLFNNSMIVTYALLQHMIVGSQMSVDQTNAAAINIQSNTDGSFVTLKCY